jgi:hypothetical protein
MSEASSSSSTTSVRGGGVGGEARDAYFEVSSHQLFTPTQRIIWHFANLQQSLHKWPITSSTTNTNANINTSSSSISSAPPTPSTLSTTATASPTGNNNNGVKDEMVAECGANGLALRLLVHQTPTTTAAAALSTNGHTGGSGSMGIIGWSTEVKFVFRRYRLLFALDASPSLANMVLFIIYLYNHLIISCDHN